MENKKRRAVITVILLAAVLLLAAFGLLNVALSAIRAVPEPTPEPTFTPAPTAVPTATPYVPAPPEITLLGENPCRITAGIEPFADPGCEAFDTLDGDLTAAVECVVDVFPYRAGEGTVTYTVTDSEGMSAQVIRRVIVEPAPAPEAVEPEWGSIYLTFDDGPSANTARLLDILDAYGAKATWFVTHTHPDYTDMLAEIAARGHTVALHSASHNYDRIYSSEEAYFADLRELQDVIFEQTGQRPTIVRFPGGGSNTVSWQNPGIMTRLDECLTDMGYVWYDWNVTAADTAPDAGYYTVVNNVRGGCSSRDWSVVLQHDTNAFSVDAVEAILQWGQTFGYTFRALDDSVPAVHHTIAN